MTVWDFGRALERIFCPASLIGTVHGWKVTISQHFHLLRRRRWLELKQNLIVYRRGPPAVTVAD